MIADHGYRFLYFSKQIMSLHSRALNVSTPGASAGYKAVEEDKYGSFCQP